MVLLAALLAVLPAWSQDKPKAPAPKEVKAARKLASKDCDEAVRILSEKAAKAATKDDGMVMAGCEAFPATRTTEESYDTQDAELRLSDMKVLVEQGCGKMSLKSLIGFVDGAASALQPLAVGTRQIDFGSGHSTLSRADVDGKFARAADALRGKKAAAPAAKPAGKASEKKPDADEGPTGRPGDCR